MYIVGELEDTYINGKETMIEENEEENREV